MAKINNSVADSISSRDISISFQKNLEEAIKRNLIGIDNDGNIKIWLESPASSSDEISASVTQEGPCCERHHQMEDQPPTMTTSASLSECMKKNLKFRYLILEEDQSLTMTTSAGRSTTQRPHRLGHLKPP